MALKGVNQGLAGFAQFGQTQLKNKGQRILNEGAQMELDTKKANENLALMETFGVVKVNPTTARYELTDNYYDAYQKIPESERGAIFNGDSLFGAYTDKDGEKKMGELGAAITIDKLPTSMKDENGDPTEAGKQFIADGKKGIIIPTKREDGMFSFLTRNRSAEEEDDEGIVLSPTEFGGLLEFRANKLNVLSDANRARAGNLASQQAGTLQGQGTGSNNVTADDQMDMLQGVYNKADGDENIAGTGSQTDVLGGLLEQWKASIGEDRQNILDAQTQAQGTGPRQGQIGIDFKNEKEEFFKKINLDKIKNNTDLTLIKNTGDFKKLIPSIETVIDGSFDPKGGASFPTNTALYKFWKSKEGNEGSSRMSKDWQAVQNDPTQLAELASEYLPAVKQQLSDAGYDLKYLEDFATGDATSVEAPSTQVEFPDYPDLSNITTKEGALELLESGKMDNLLTPDLIAEAQKKLTDEGINDAESFKKAVREERIKNPYAYATIMAMYMAPAGKASPSDTAVQRNEILNLLATDDASQTKQELVARQESIVKTKSEIAKNLAAADKSVRAELIVAETDLRTKLDSALKSMTDESGDSNVAGDYKVAITSTLGMIDLYESLGMEDGALALRARDPRAFKKMKEVIASAADTELKGAVFPLSFEFWGDLLERSRDKKTLFTLNFDNLAVIRDSEDEATKIVAIQTDGTYRIEADQSTPAFNMQESLSPEIYNILLRILPDVSNNKKFNKKAQDKKAGA